MEGRKIASGFFFEIYKKIFLKSFQLSSIISSLSDLANNFSSLLSYLEAIEASQVSLCDLCNKKTLLLVILNVNNLRVYIIVSTCVPDLESPFVFSQFALFFSFFFEIRAKINYNSFFIRSANAEEQSIKWRWLGWNSLWRWSWNSITSRRN